VTLRAARATRPAPTFLSASSPGSLKRKSWGTPCLVLDARKPSNRPSKPKHGKKEQEPLPPTRSLAQRSSAVTDERADALASLRAVYRSVTACGRCALRIAQAMGLIDQESGMKTPCGTFRKLTNAQIREVLRWHQEAIEFRHSHGTIRDLASLLGVSFDAVRGCFERRSPDTAESGGVRTPHSATRRGRPRHLNGAQIAFAIAWLNARREFHARHGNIASLARRLGVGASTIHDCIRRNGEYRQRALAKARRSDRTQSPFSMNARRSALLRSWRRP
jgi:hypothetical protein